ncbi:PGF-pre-PGF domain-containing protein [Halohasta litchfieldiae]|uniref:PGF-pre-PGF domain-containing protein n=1 Tax=Halohasta litchfieldiae TaxID=1073996 RepID=A0A1H6TZ87_9EURY|nr:PGF-pre-PGF domain-containing protein [Halohasta litchfieldiae]ATW87115.1 PGF-pre-PGF domain-containing protein [Halohasta litchfieldiae]SEI85438.1 PGF-pre-PGF domain-containing protein [Halohasta litchfieldiae]
MAVDSDGFDDTPAFEGRAVGFTRVDHGSAAGDTEAGDEASEADAAGEDSEVASATFEFTVSASRLDEIEVDADDATVYRHHDGAWQPLKTDVVDRDAESYQLRAETPGFSMFAVGLQEADLLSVNGASATRSSVDVGAPIAVSATVENTGRWNATGSIELLANNATTASEPVTVAAGDSETITLETSFDEAGVYELRIGTTNAGTVVVGDGASTAGEGSADQGSTDRESTVSDATGDGESPLGALFVGVVVTALAGIGLLYRKRNLE